MKKQSLSFLLALAFVLMTGCGAGSSLPPESSSSAGASPLSASSKADSAVSQGAEIIDLKNYEALTKEYLTPLALASITADSWSSAQEIAPHRLGLFYAAKKSCTDGSDPVNWDTASFDAQEVEAFVKSYFDISSDSLRSSDFYHEDSASYTFESLGGAASCRVVGTELNDGNLLLNFEYYSPADDTTVIREGVVTIAMGQDSYKFISCTTQEVE